MYHSEISEDFRSHFGSDPDFIAEVPGRVNLIGEHTDYNGLPVLPISIDKTIKAAVKSTSSRNVRIINKNSDYAETVFELSEKIEPSPKGHWGNYIKAASQALYGRTKGELFGADIFFEGNLPASAGLSSSSALVVISALALLAANKTEMDFIELAEILAEGEKYVGTQGGGMDQAICLLGKKDCAVKIDFFPLRHQYVPFPADYSVIVAHSLVKAKKTGNAMWEYNRRPIECRIATACINSVYRPDPPLKRLGDLRKDIYGKLTGKSLESFIRDIFKKDSYGMADLEKMLGKSAYEINEQFLSFKGNAVMPVPESGFLLRQRAIHVFTEAERVDKSCDAMRNNDPAAFGKLMKESHDSCKLNYGISTPELDTLVSIMEKSGAEGARLTGAGFGGCAIALAKKSESEKIITDLKNFYYYDFIKNERPDFMERFRGDGSLFQTSPFDGASIKKL